MPVFYELPILSTPSQEFSTVLNGQDCQFKVQYNRWNDRWSFDLTINDELKLSGRRIVIGTDLIQPFDLGIGELWAFRTNEGAEPDRTQLPDGLVRLVSVQEV